MAGRFTFRLFRSTSGWVAALTLVALALGFLDLRSPYFRNRPSIDGRLVVAIAGIVWEISDGRAAPAGLPSPRYYDREGLRDLVAYERLGPTRYRLCASFARATAHERRVDRYPAFPHPAGRSCFVFSTMSRRPVAARATTPASRAPTASR